MLTTVKFQEHGDDTGGTAQEKRQDINSIAANNGERAVGTDSSTPETSNHLDCAQEVLCKSILRAQMDSMEYKEAMRMTFETRARVRSLLAGFLLDHPVGQSLVNAGVFTHPVIKEQEKQEEKIRQLAEMMEETSPHIGRVEAELTARYEADFQPRSAEKVVLDTLIDAYADIREVTAGEYDANRHIDYRYGFDFNHLISRAPILISKDRETLRPLFPEVILERKTAHLRDRFFKLLGDKDWSGLLELLQSQYRSPEFGKQLQCWVFERRHYIFPNKHFRMALFRKMMIIIIEDGQIEFEMFDTFWQDTGLDLSDTKELKKLTKKAFPIEKWQDLREEDPHRYLRLRDLLESYGISP